MPQVDWKRRAGPEQMLAALQFWGAWKTLGCRSTDLPACSVSLETLGCRKTRIVTSLRSPCRQLHVHLHLELCCGSLPPLPRPRLDLTSTLPPPWPCLGPATTSSPLRSCLHLIADSTSASPRSHLGPLGPTSALPPPRSHLGPTSALGRVVFYEYSRSRRSEPPDRTSWPAQLAWRS